MAIYHCSVSVGTRANGQSAKAKVDYITRQGRYSDKAVKRAGEKTWKVEARELLTAGSGNMPAWAKDNPRKYWSAADNHERSNGVLFRQIIFALPIELTPEQQVEAVEDFAEKVTGKQLPYTFAIHRGKARNPHCHLILSEKMNDGIARTAKTWFKRANKKSPEKGGAVKADISSRRREWLDEVRKFWEEVANQALKKVGSKARIDRRSLYKQGIKRRPTFHKGPDVVAMEKKGIETKRMALFQVTKEAIKVEQESTMKKAWKKVWSIFKPQPAPPEPVADNHEKTMTEQFYAADEGALLEAEKEEMKLPAAADQELTGADNDELETSPKTPAQTQTYIELPSQSDLSKMSDDELKALLPKVSEQNKTYLESVLRTREDRRRKKSIDKKKSTGIGFND